MNTSPYRQPLEVADILRAHGEAYRLKHHVSPEQAQVMQRLANAVRALGGHVDNCNGWASRGSPTTPAVTDIVQSAKRASEGRWLETRLAAAAGHTSTWCSRCPTCCIP